MALRLKKLLYTWRLQPKHVHKYLETYQKVKPCQKNIEFLNTIYQIRTLVSYAFLRGTQKKLHIWSHTGLTNSFTVRGGQKKRHFLRN